ncbi:MAG: hypothetical protein M1825_001860 [Sarcosagium campestre]|nr:MAG: hypothetical protein M1825_001860 [Sarcosagium campestre]
MATSSDAEAALLEWIKIFCSAAGTTSLRQLGSPHILWDVLREIDPEYFSDEPALDGDRNEKTWLPIWQKLKPVYKHLLAFIRDKCGQTLSLDESSIPDLKRIATNKDHESEQVIDEVVKLLKVVLYAAVFSPSAIQFLGKIQGMSVSTQHSIKSIIEELSTPSPQQSPSPSPRQDGHPSRNDEADALLLEQRLGTMVQENEQIKLERKKLQNQVRDLDDRLDQLREDNTELKALLESSERQLDELRSGREDGAPNAGGSNFRLRQQEDLIANQEAELTNLRAQAESQERQISGLLVTAKRVQDLQDRLDEYRAEREGLVKKANAADRYRQKLQANQDLDKQNRDLRSEIEHLVAASTSGAKERHNAEELQATIQSYRITLEKVERDFSELQGMKRRLEDENIALGRRCESLREQSKRDKQNIGELEEKIQDLEQAAAPTGPSESLGDELADAQESQKSKTDLKLTISKLKVEVDRLRASSNVDTTGPGQEVYDAVNRKAKSFESQYLDALQEKLALEAQLEAIAATADKEGSAVVISLREKLAAAQSEASSAIKNLSLKEDGLAEAMNKIRLLEVQLDLATKNDEESIQELTKSLSIDYEGVTLENKQLRSQIRELKADTETTRDLLNRALLDKDHAEKTFSSNKDDIRRAEKTNTELKSTLEVLRATNQGRAEGGQAAVEDHLTRMHERMEDLHERHAIRAQVNEESIRLADKITAAALRKLPWFRRLTDSVKHIKKQDAVIKELQDELRQLRESKQEAGDKIREERAEAKKVLFHPTKHPPNTRPTHHPCAAESEVLTIDIIVMCYRPSKKRSTRTSADKTPSWRQPGTISVAGYS